MQHLLDTIWNHGIFIAERSQNPVLYPFFLSAIAFSLLLGIVNFVIDIRSKTFGRVLTAEIIWLVVFEALPIYAVWLAFATPPTTLFLAGPAIGSSWFFLPAPQTYTVIAVICHGVLSTCALVLAIGWLVQIRLPSDSRRHVLCRLVALLGIAAGWEIQHWPVTFVVVAELLVVAPFAAPYIATFIWGTRDSLEIRYARRLLATQILAATFGIALILLWHDSTLVQWYLLATLVAVFILSLRYMPQYYKAASSQERAGLLFRYILASTAATLLLWIIGVIAQARWHVVDPSVFNIAAVFYLLIQLDAIFLAAFGLQFKRAAFLPLIAIAVTLIAASGAFVSITHNHGITYTIWLEGGIAAATYLLVSPLTHLAQEAYRIERVAEERDAQERILRDLIISQPSPAIQAPSGAWGNSRTPDSDNPLQQLWSQFQQALPQQGARRAGIQREYEMLQFQGGIFFLLLGVCYHWIALNPDILAALNGNLIGLVFAGIAAFTGILAISVDRNNDASRAILLLLLLLTGTLVGVDILLNTAFSGQMLSVSAPQNAFNLFTNHQIALFTIRSVVEETLVLLAGGQFFYLIVTLIAYLSNLAEGVSSDLQQRMD